MMTMEKGSTRSSIRHEKPSARRAAAGIVEVRAAVRRCSLGQVLVASTARGVCLIALDDDAGVLEHELHARFPQATVRAEDAAAGALADQVVDAIEGRRRTNDVPIDFAGTPFQEKVWNALRAIPAGTTSTYSEVAARIGAPRAVRAVGTACGRNPIAILVPCHRVLREDGALGGFRWGLERKTALLDRERRA